MKYGHRRSFAALAAVFALAISGLFALTVAPSSSADLRRSCDLYVAPTGSDSNSGSSSTPFATIAHLVGALQAGQTGCLAAGVTVTGDFSLSTSMGTSTAPITITSESWTSLSTIKGRVVTSPGANWLTFSYLNFDGRSPNTTSPSPTIGSDHVTFSHDDVTNVHTGICFDLINSSYGVANYTTIDRSRIHDCGRLPYGSTNNDHGIYASGNFAVITNNYIYHNADRGVQLRGSQGAIVQHNIVDGNGEGVIFGDLHASNNEVSNNIFSNSVTRWLAESYWGTTGTGTGNSFHDNCVWPTNSNSAYDTNGGISGTGFSATANLIADPLYVNPGTGDYTLQAGSPCLADAPAP